MGGRRSHFGGTTTFGALAMMPAAVRRRMSSDWPLEAQFFAERRRRARDAFQLAFRHQREAMGERGSRGRHLRLASAIHHYQRSLDLFATAETFTYLGWAHSLTGDFHAAIAACLRAIALDPDYGNPYNDVGVYLVEEGCHDQAIGYFLQAIGASRYESVHFAHYNLGRVLLTRGRLREAELHFRKALEFDPHYSLAKEALRQLEVSRDATLKPQRHLAQGR